MAGCVGMAAAGDLGYLTGFDPGLDRMRGPSRGSRLARWLLPPLLAFLLVQGMLLGAASAVGRGGRQYLDPSMRGVWDGGQYLAIARSGYTLVHCDPNRTPFEATDWCGRAGWFPLYPALLHVGHDLTGWDLAAIGWGLSELLALGVLLLVWWLLGATVTVANLSCLGLAAVFPGSIYDHAIFPISLCTFASLACLGLVVRERWLLAGLAGAVAAAAYPLGAALALVVGVWLLVLGRGRLRVRLPRAAAAGGLALAGLALVGWVMQRAVGHWDAYLLVQRSYGNGVHNPLTIFRANLVTPRLWHVSPEPVVSRLQLAHAPQVAFALFTVVVWLAPLVAGGRVSQYRQYALLLPAVVLLRDLPRALQLGLLGVATLCTFAMAMLFYVNMLI